MHFAIFAIFVFLCFGMFGRIVFQASAAPGSSRSKVVTGTTTASAAPPGVNLIKLFFSFVTDAKPNPLILEQGKI